MEALRKVSVVSSRGKWAGTMEAMRKSTACNSTAYGEKRSPQLPFLTTAAERRQGDRTRFVRTRSLSFQWSQKDVSSQRTIPEPSTEQTSYITCTAHTHKHTHKA